jgi:uncharacterized protein YbjT (DUF2867 family)
LSGAVFLTGATGFLGGALAAELAAPRRARPTRSCASPRARRRSRRPARRCTSVDLREPASVARALGASCAGGARPRRASCTAAR